MSAASRPARAYALLTTVTAVVTIALKLVAYALTGSVGLFSDAAESLVNLLAALLGLWMLTVAARPPDEEHAYGHFKVEYFASGLEGALILITAATIVLAAWPRLLDPQPLEQVGPGLTISVVAAAINGGVALILLRAGRRLRSITLRSNANHLLTDVWTTGGVLVGVLLAQSTGYLVVDPVLALIVAANIVWAGIRLLRDTGAGLLDPALPTADQQRIQAVLARYKDDNIVFHALRTRGAGARSFVSVHVLVPGEWTVRRGHDLCEAIEMSIRRELPETTVFTHLEPLEDPTAWDDVGLDRPQGVEIEP